MMECSWKVNFIWGAILLSLRVTHQQANVALSGVAEMSSLGVPSFPASLAIDGNSDTSNSSQSCVSTGKQNSPWWRLDMRGPYIIKSIEIFRRSDGNNDPLDGCEVRIGNSLENNGNNNPRCEVTTVTTDTLMTFHCDKMEGRFINIFKPAPDEIIELCEVRVLATANIKGANVAPRGTPKHVEVSSSEYHPYLAIDEYSRPVVPLETCVKIPQKNYPWWELDLKSIYHITAVSIVSEDCCQEQLNGAEIRIGYRNSDDNPMCANFSAEAGQRIYDYQCGLMDGRFVQVILDGVGRNFTLCEVQVFGTVLENVALRGVAFQSSAGKASRVLDGIHSTCSMTEDKPGQWVKIDLLAPYSVKVIQLAFKEDCCYNIEVYIDDTRCSTMFSTSNSLVTMYCGGTVGRSVKVIHPDKPLTLCEVEVYTTWENPQNVFPQLPPPHEHCSTDKCSRNYIIVHHEPMTWFQAQTYCREMHSDLASINNAQDMNTLVDEMYEHSVYQFWIGLYEDVVTWRWSLTDHRYYQADEAEFRNWGTGEPNNVGGMEHCAGIRETGQWEDLDCDLPHYFICFDGRTGASQTQILITTPMRWADAQWYCRRTYTDLVSVRSLAENKEIQSMVPAGKLAWIGLFGDSWKWSDGSSSSFRFWKERQPVSSGGGSRCAHFNGETWSSTPCDTKSMFVCYSYKRKSLVKISTDIDVRDPVIQQQIQKKLEAAMERKGIPDFNLRWRRSGVLHKAAQSMTTNAEKTSAEDECKVNIVD